MSVAKKKKVTDLGFRGINGISLTKETGRFSQF